MVISGNGSDLAPGFRDYAMHVDGAGTFLRSDMVQRKGVAQAPENLLS
jgi:hypothetical protein